ncbi:3-deoxy-D-manno-octulosonate 8-phosphate phosphatase [Enhygromyxa salina]|uniref:3-deoxy-D-manno-octulosonate 8-phosphate phosphatase n=1 Tax=Enhygromyxa salina TaxID=215803 RepID=A0A0C2CXF3_9BACT|nr:HAD hydrolase family protein [Enhygromyxa salina]KIG12517.1 3-deoxy-D-manno-octulosonate 8-phosphate phosphatase [Enhygromyxa salina]
MPSFEARTEDQRVRLASIELLTFDIDGTLTDATTWWAGEPVGWVQRYSVRDGEALLRIARAGLPVVPLSRNKTASARRRIEHLGCAPDWLGVTDKIGALEQIRERHGAVAAQHVLHVGDGLDDAPVFGQVGLGVAVADAHPEALRAAHLVLEAVGGARAIEELEARLRGANNPRLLGNRETKRGPT